MRFCLKTWYSIGIPWLTDPPQSDYVLFIASIALSPAYTGNMDSSPFGKINGVQKKPKCVPNHQWPPIIILMMIISNSNQIFRIFRPCSTLVNLTIYPCIYIYMYI